MGVLAKNNRSSIYLLPCPLKLLLKLRQLSPAALQLHNVRLQNKIAKYSKVRDSAEYVQQLQIASDNRENMTW